VSELCGCRSGLLRSSRKPRRQGSFVDLERPRPGEPYEPLIRGPKCRLDARAHLRLVGFGCDEQRAKSGDLARGIDCVVVWPAARTVVLCCSAELPGHSGADGCWISPFLQRDRCFVNVGDALACPIRRHVRAHASLHVRLPPLPGHETTPFTGSRHRARHRRGGSSSRCGGLGLAGRQGRHRR
jgi:hypothetical protein